ncbi:MAG TPA: hypothetical protein VHN12_08700, partial [Geobacteraceae bacterium]|nr:hypothetical protein [Geobacteraceae bacterium]
MNKVLGVKLFKKWCMAIMVLLIGVFLHARADAINLKVVYPVVVTNTGGTQTVVYQPITGGFRWLLEEDNTVDIKPGVPVVNPLALQVHNSTAPVAKAGHSNTATAIVTRPKQLRYQVSVLPDAGYAMGGALLPVGKDTVTVIVNPLPLPTAQVSVFVFNDNNPINNAPDLTEPGLTGFNVLIFDQLGQMSLDAFGNPLGTEYQRVNPADPKSDFVFDADGNPVVSVLGSGVLTTDATGNVIIKNINPGKYGIRAIAPIGSPWVQTNTI